MVQTRNLRLVLLMLSKRCKSVWMIRQLNILKRICLIWWSNFELKKNVRIVLVLGQFYELTCHPSKYIWKLVERIGIEPMTPCLQSRCSPSWANAPSNFALGKFKELVVVGRGGLEPPTSRLSGVRSNQLSYRPLQTSSSLKFFYILKRYEDGSVNLQSEDCYAYLKALLSVPREWTSSCC